MNSTSFLPEPHHRFISLTQFYLMSSEIHIGEPSSPEAFKNDGFRSEWQTIHFHNFDNLNSDENIDSPTFSCFGCQWKLQLYKNFQDFLFWGDGYIPVKISLISLVSAADTKISGSFRCVTVNNIGKPCGRRYHPFTVGYSDSKTSFHDTMNMKISEDDRLVHGTLTIGLEMYAKSDSHVASSLVTETQLRQVIVNILSDEDTADVSFDVKGQMIHAHLNILKAMAPDFVRTLNLEEHDKSTPIPIGDVDPDIFRSMMKYIYGDTSAFKVSECGRDVIDAADKYGEDNLKLYAEKCYVDSIDLNADNVADMLLYADGKSCHVLRKIAMDFAVANVDDVLQSSSFKVLCQSESIMREIMGVMSKRQRIT